MPLLLLSKPDPLRWAPVWGLAGFSFLRLHFGSGTGGDIGLRKCQSILHCLCGGDLGRVVQMGINVGGGGKIRMSQPLLDLLQRYTVGKQQTCAGMAQIVKAEDEHTVS